MGVRETFKTAKRSRTEVRKSIRIMHRQCVGMCEGRELLGRKAFALVLYCGPRAEQVLAASDDLTALAAVADEAFYSGYRTLVGLGACAPLPQKLGARIRR